MKLISNKTWNYPFAVVIWIGLFLLLQFLLKNADLTDQLWGLLALVGSGLIVLSSITNVPKRQTAQLVFFGTQTGVWIDEGYYFLFHLFTLDDEHEAQHKEYQTLIIEPYEITLTDGIFLISHNLKYREGKSNLPHPTPEDEHQAKENFKNNKSEDMKDDFTDLVKNIDLLELTGKDYQTAARTNFKTLIIGDDMFFDECKHYGVSFANALTYIRPKDSTLENEKKNLKKINDDLKDLFPDLTDLQRADMALTLMGKAKRISSDAPVINRHDVV